MKDLKKFKKIDWSDIPDLGLYSDQVVDFIDNKLISFFPDTLNLSPSMINNYVKKGILPKPIKKKYYKEHIAYLIVVIILKQTIPIAKIKEGIDLQMKIMDTEDGFNQFMQILEDAYNKIIESINDKKKIVYEGFVADKKNISITLAINAFCFQTITTYILNRGGLYAEQF
ncbi:MAG: DUF1836 domain-containing protein [Anaerococcus sp.]